MNKRAFIIGIIGAKFICALILFGGLFFCLQVRAENSDDYRFDNWATDAGLPQNSVLALTQTRDGYLWFTTFDGLVRFDGVRFTVFDRSNTKAVVSNRFACLFEDSGGALWAGSEYGGLIRYDDGEFRNFSLSGVLPTATVHLIQQTTNEDLIVSTDSGAFRKESSENSFSPYSTNEEILRRKDFWSVSGAKWSADSNGVHEYRDGKTVDYPFYISEFKANEFFYEDREKSLWIGAADNIYRLQNGITVRYEKNGVRTTITNRVEIQMPDCAFYQDFDGDIWAGNERGLTVFKPNGDGWRHFAVDNGLPSNAIHTIRGDREGNVWLGTLDRGIIRASRRFISTVSVVEGLRGENIYPIFADDSGKVWIGNDIVSSVENNVVTNHDEIGNGKLGTPQSFYEDRQKRLWVGFQRGIGYYENGKFTDLSKTVENRAILVIKQNLAGEMWFGTDLGLIKFVNGDSTFYTVRDGLPNDEIKDIYEDGRGVLWIATYGGFAELIDGKFTVFNEQNGLVSNRVRTITGESDGTLWFGTYDGGLSRFKNGKFTNYTTADGLFNNGVFRILEDDSGNFWMSSNRGIYRVAKKQLNDFADGKISAITSVAYGKQDGMLSTECNGGRQPAGTKTSDGRLWFPSQKGVVVINPAAVPFNSQPPPTVIESVKIDNQEIDKTNADVVLQPGQTSLEITYTGLSLIKSEQVRFRYKLENLDGNWTEAGTRRSAYYSYLPLGDYVFTVAAANADGVWNEIGQSIKIRVVPPFYRTWWFSILFVLAIFALVFSAYRLRLRQIESKHRAQEAFSRRLIDSQEQERKRIAAELHDSLGQLLVVIKNRARLGLKVENNVEATENHLDGISDAASQAIEEVKEISFNLRPYLLDKLGLTKTLRSMLGKVFEASGIVLTTEIDDVDDVFPKDLEILFYRIVQESANNIIKHSAAKNAKIAIERRAGLLILRISDDGKGFDKTAQAQSVNRSFGLIGIAERARLLDGTHFFASEIGKGTTLTVKINLHDLQNA